MKLQIYLGRCVAWASALLVTMTIAVPAEAEGSRNAPVVLADLDVDSVAALMVASGADGRNICSMLSGKSAVRQSEQDQACTALQGQLFPKAEAWESRLKHSKEIYLRLDGFALVPMGFDSQKGVLNFCMPRRLKTVLGKPNGAFSGLRLGRKDTRVLLSISGPDRSGPCPKDSMSRADLNEARQRYSRPFRRWSVATDQLVAEAVLETAETNGGHAALRGPVICRITEPRNSGQLAGCELVAFTMSNPAPDAQPNLFFWDAAGGLYIGAN